MAMIYAIGRQGYWTGASREIGDRDGMPRGWTRRPVPDLTPDEYAIWNGNEWNVTAVPPPGPVIAPADVNAERDRRLAADFTFAGIQFQRDAVSVQRISGAATLAGFAIAAGAQPGDLRWHGGDTDFAWIASDNTLVPMDAQTAFAFGQTCANVETRLVFAAKALREMEPIPHDFADDGYWQAE